VLNVSLHLRIGTAAVGLWESWPRGQDRSSRVLAEDDPRRIAVIAAWQVSVHDDDIGPGLAEEGNALLPVLGDAEDVVAAHAQPALEGGAVVGPTVDDDDPRAVGDAELVGGNDAAGEE
jgi:hypothetical protein